nr:protease-helicase NS3 [Bat hepacivirus]
SPITAQLKPIRGWWTGLAVSLTGRDKLPHKCQVCVLATPARTFCGTAVGASFYTVYHGAGNKGIAGPHGAVYPISADPAEDITVYPSLSGMSGLEVCRCSTTDYYLITRTSDVRPVYHDKGKDRYLLTCPCPVRNLKGSSGCPVVCAKGHCLGIFRAASTVRGVARGIKLVQVADRQATVQNIAGSDLTEPPVVPNTYSVKFLHAPTGSGKSTKMPAAYVGQGYRTLVCNPSVATTRSMGPYMAKAYNINPSVRTGDYVIETGEKLTYSTYGKLLADGVNGLAGFDVVVCDECHSTDSTSVLGIGHILDTAESAGVKLVILATATPPGAPTVPHPNVQEVQLSMKGDIKFYGKMIESSNLHHGRHLIFCHSKKKCDELAAKLNQMGITAVSYYRGKNLSVIPVDGDVVVVATDALMTGYTGNFDSVYDCNVATEMVFEMDYSPTFSLNLSTRPSDSVQRTQRRGRTGRGKQGVYYFCDKGESPSGICDAAVMLECYDSGLAWFDLSPNQVTVLLAAYANQPGLPVLSGSTELLQSIVEALVEVDAHVLSQYKQLGESYPYLCAAQVTVCHKARAAPPSCEDRWKPCKKGKTVTPLLYKIGKTHDQWTDSHPITKAICACLDAEVTTPT